MEKLSIEEKAKRYDLAIEAAKSIYNNMKESGNFGGIEDLEVIFPELAESEDERIRNALISVLTSDFEKDTTIDGITVGEILTWLEKQDEQNPKFRIGDTIKKESTGDIVTISDIDLKNREYRLNNTGFIPFKYEYLWELIEQKPSDRVESKFKVGDWISHNTANFVFQVVSFGSCGYEVINRDNHTYIISFDNEDNYHLWTIQDAKDGDVLQFKGRPFIYNGYLEEKKYPFAYGGIYLDGSFFISNGSLPWAHSDVYPATKEQRDILFHEMKEDGYEWNAEKKELKKIEQKSIEWSEEDENMFGSIRSTLSMYMNNLSLPKEIRDIHKKELEWFDELYDRGLS